MTTSRSVAGVPVGPERPGWRPVLFALVAGLLAAPAGASCQDLPRVEVSVGVAPRPLLIRSGLVLQAAVDAAARRRSWRWVFGAAYARELGSHGSCCGPNPGYTYQLETIEASAGIEVPLFVRHGWSLAIDGRFSPMLYREIRRGFQADFQPGPTAWHFTPQILSIGTTIRAATIAHYQLSLRFRTRVLLDALPHGQIPRTGWSIGVGVGL
ncbi:MAG: hypothetical protein P8Z36_09030 [Gemmatimonadota bacterium]|jgi:hypothetical protein